ncbi:acyl-CoA dehydrogenase family protein [Pseudonocardia endophytica]|uniref:Alkylation response protein AidB-like acyl-CoA dehydrogenase n=1 Tax=Pseudonocardia endophytica TaxID=401976 RepID=A0A4R1I0Z2_PSEEN|nr:acyl-CoA dehydrogenase family protein [Pseudonocardia endophytica]TCK27581.1 alkylation response protein AidB-like acyl-CoA dehydrogenase [Pseudonocardia endophytica]
MDFELDDEHRALQDAVRRMLTRHADDAAVAGWDASETFPEHVYARLAAMGLCGLTFEESDGGSGIDELAVCLVVEELARASGALAWAYLSTVSVTARAVARYGTLEQRRGLLPGIASGEQRIAIAFTEPDAGSDITAATTRAVVDGDRVVLTGQKVFTTGADTAGHVLVLARTDPAASPSRGFSLLLVPTTAAGVAIRKLTKMAGQSLHTCEVFLDRVPLTSADVLGGPEAVGHGLRAAFASLDCERVATAAMGLGIAQGALDKAGIYAAQREQFGARIADLQAVAHMLADMSIATDAARLLTWRAATGLQNRSAGPADAATAKVAATEIGTRVANLGMQVLGGYSYMTEYGMERYWREAKLYEIAAGTNQVLRSTIARHLVDRATR